ncbi:MAG: hypothetical protein OEQ39_06945 [Gammaproteobacteria bacterium]|nr:hypothetical protein [Gammaproteobacteria bacterium]MDH3467331.1 hypothetical protein [Gammaproteobacteria bacterium]
MESHWLDPSSPELSGERFSQTFIYGSYEGRVTTLEPMITHAFIESVRAQASQVVTMEVPQPRLVAKPGRYPTPLSVRYDAELTEFTVALEGLTHRPAVIALENITSDYDQPESE